MIPKLLAFYAKLSKRERWILYGSAAVVAALLLDRLVIGPIYRKLASLDTQIQQEERVIKQSLYVLLRKDQVLSDGKQLVLLSLEAKNPEQETTDLLRDLENMAKNAGISLLYVKPGLLREEPGAKKYHASLECEAEVGQIASFFHVIESSNQLLRIEKYDIQPKSRESSIARCTVTVSKTVFS